MVNRNLLKYSFVLLFSLYFLTDTNAQDPRFAQFYAAPMHTNPAMTGVFEGRWRFNANYRDQWSSILNANPFRTIHASYDMKYHIVGDDFVAFGVNLLRDEAGRSHFTTNRGYVNVAYMKQLAGGKYRSDDQYLVAGGQFGAGQNSVKQDRLWFSNQFDNSNGVPDFNQDPNDPLVSGGDISTDLYLDFNAGLLWYALFDDNMSIYLGGAYNHLNSPNVSFTGRRATLAPRWVANAGGELPITTELSILPAILVMGQGPSFSTTFGANFRYNNHDWRELAIRIGMWPHFVQNIPGQGSSMDALVFTTVLEVERWNLGISYDINTSSLNLATNSRGAFELSLIYTHPANSRYKVNCPKF